MHIFSPTTKAKSSEVNENFEGLSNGTEDTDNNRLQLYRAEAFADFVADGLVWSIVSGLNGTMTTGIAYITDTIMGRIVIASIASKTFTASKDTYVDVGYDGTVYYTEVANGATSGMTISAGRIRIAKVVTNGSAITSIVQISADPLGNVIYNQSPIRYIVEEGWQAPTLLNSWANYGGGYNPVGYRKDSAGIVHLRGLFRNGTDGATVFTLPVGYRPEYRMLFSGSSADAYGRIDVDTNGNVTPSASTTSPTWVSLDGLTFRSYQ